MSVDFVFPAVKFLEPIGCLTKSKPATKCVDSTKMPFRAPSLFAENYARTTTELKVGQCELEELPELVGAFYLLQELDLSENALEFLPPDIGSCYSLRILNFSTNKITAIPDEVRMLCHLEILLGSNNQIATIPSWIGSMPLKEFNLFNNKVLTLPMEEGGLGALSSMQELNLSSNVIMQLPDEAMSSWMSLRVLNMFDCRLTKVGSFSHLVNLEELRLFNNNLEDTPDLGSKLHKLKILELNKNHIKGALPLSFFSGLHSIERIVLNHNEIEQLPIGINCPKLESLMLTKNCLTELPADLPLSRALKVLFVNENNLESLPETFVQNTWIERCNLARNAKIEKNSPHISAHIKAACAQNEGRFWGPNDM